MSAPYTGNPSNIATPGLAATLSDPSDGDAGNSVSVGAPFQSGADYIEMLQQQLFLTAVTTFTRNPTSAFSFPNGVAEHITATGQGGGLEIMVAANAASGTGPWVYFGSQLDTPTSVTGGSFAGAMNVGRFLNNAYFLGGASGLWRCPVASSPLTAGNWTKVDSSSNYNDICYGAALTNPYLACINAAPFVLSSLDGVTWTSRTLTGGAAVGVFATNGSKALVGATGGTSYWVTTDGATWGSAKTAPFTFGGKETVIYSTRLGLWIAVAQNGSSIYTTTDPSTAGNWTLRYSSATRLVQVLEVANRGLVAYDYQSSGPFVISAITTTDGLTWKKRYVTGLAVWGLACWSSVMSCMMACSVNVTGYFMWGDPLPNP